MGICLSLPAAHSLHVPVLSGVGWMLPDAHPGTASLPFLTRVQEENKMRKLLGQEAGRLLTYCVMSRTDMTWRKINVMFCQLKREQDDKKQNPTHLLLSPFSPCFFFGSSILLHLQFLLSSPSGGAREWGVRVTVSAKQLLSSAPSPSHFSPALLWVLTGLQSFRINLSQHEHLPRCLEHFHPLLLH